MNGGVERDLDDVACGLGRSNLGDVSKIGAELDAWSQKGTRWMSLNELNKLTKAGWQVG